MTLAGFLARGAAIGALIGGAVGLLLGLITYPPTACFASIEIGVPAAIAGVVIGRVVAGIGAIDGATLGASAKRPTDSTRANTGEPSPVCWCGCGVDRQQRSTSVHIPSGIRAGPSLR